MRARIVWFSQSMGGRDSGPPTGPNFRPNALFFKLRNDAPEATTLFAGVLLDFVGEEDGATLAEIRPTAPELLTDYWQEGATLLLMEGSRPVGYARLLEG